MPPLLGAHIPYFWGFEQSVVVLHVFITGLLVLNVFSRLNIVDLEGTRLWQPTYKCIWNLRCAITTFKKCLYGKHTLLHGSNWMAMPWKHNPIIPTLLGHAPPTKSSLHIVNRTKAHPACLQSLFIYYCIYSLLSSNKTKIYKKLTNNPITWAIIKHVTNFNCSQIWINIHYYKHSLLFLRHY